MRDFPPREPAGEPLEEMLTRELGRSYHEAFDVAFREEFIGHGNARPRGIVQASDPADSPDSYPPYDGDGEPV